MDLRTIKFYLSSALPSFRLEQPALSIRVRMSHALSVSNRPMVFTGRGASGSMNEGLCCFPMIVCNNSPRL